MSNKFNGFSTEEIQQVAGGVGAKNKKVTTMQENFKPAFRGAHVGIRRVPEKSFKPTEQIRKQQQQQQTQQPHLTKQLGKQDNGITKPKTQQPVENGISFSAIDFEGGLSKSIEEALFYPTLEKSNNNNEKSTEKENVKDAHDDSSLINLSLPQPSNESDDSGLTDSSLVHTPKNAQNTVPADGDSSPFKGISLKDFEKHRRMIQEQNKQKKELLYKAIEHHSQKTAAEARKIAEIKSELAKLDNDLAVDVAILRKQIDNACINFAHIEKQYMKIEAQFLKAKIDLHNAAEKKELLTEHLCTVIAHNEDRKAQKLTELMEKVGITPTGDYDVSPATANHVEIIEK